MESIISTFHIDWKIIIAQAFNFGAVFLVLYIFVIKPLNKIMADRKDKIEKGLADAKENALILESTEIKHEGILAKARLEAHDIFESVKNEADTKRKEILEEAKREAHIIIENGKEVLENEKRKIISEEHEEIVALIVSGVEKMLKDKDGNILNEKAVKELKGIK
jgi:F-type H+-transporting ATPase subunit b